MGKAFLNLLQRHGEVNSLERAGGLMRWDGQLLMPPSGAEARTTRVGRVRMADELEA